MKTTNKSKVIYKDSMGSDLTVVNAARVSFKKEATLVQVDEQGKEYTPKYDANSYYQHVAEIDGKRVSKPRLSKADVRLIRYLALHNHWTPFGHASVQFYMKVPVFVARQLVKHCVGLVLNEVSRRYIDDEPEYFMPDQWRAKAANKKQGSDDSKTITHVGGDLAHIDDFVGGGVNVADEMYKDLLHANVAPEQARMVLPQNMMTEFYWTGSLAAWMRVYDLRAKADAQEETRKVAELIGEVIKQKFPVSYYFMSNKNAILQLQDRMTFLKEWIDEEPSSMLNNKLQQLEHHYNAIYNPQEFLNWTS